MSLFSRGAIIAWAEMRAVVGTKTITVWDQEVAVTESCQHEPRLALAAALFARFQNALPDYSPNEARGELANIAWNGAGKGYVQMSLDELVSEVVSAINDTRESGCTFAGDEILEEGEEPDYASLNEFLLDVVDEPLE